MAEELKQKSRKADVLLFLARLNFARGEWKKAESNFKRALQLSEELKLPFQVAETYYYFGDALKKNCPEANGFC